MNKKWLLCYIVMLGSGINLYSSAALNYNSYYKEDDLLPVGMHQQKNDLDVSITQNPLITAVILGSFTQVKKLLEDKNNKYSDKEIAEALYYATVQDLDNITQLLSKYAIKNTIKDINQFADN